MKLIEDLIKEMKEDGFTNTRLHGRSAGFTISLPGVFLEFDHTEYENLTLGLIGYGKTKVHQLVRSYLDPELVNAWRDELTSRRGDKKRSIDTDVMMFPGGKHGHERGPCITAIGYRFVPEEGPCLTVFSRSAEFPHKFLADLWMITGLAYWLQENELTEGLPVRVRWIISLLWMDQRTANLLRASPLAIEPPYSRDEKFNFRVEEQWNEYITSGRTVSFSTLKNLVSLWRGTKRLSDQTPGQLKDFI